LSVKSFRARLCLLQCSAAPGVALYAPAPRSMSTTDLKFFHWIVMKGVGAVFPQRLPPPPQPSLAEHHHHGRGRDTLVPIPAWVPPASGPVCNAAAVHVCSRRTNRTRRESPRLIVADGLMPRAPLRRGDRKRDVTALSGLRPASCGDYRWHTGQNVDRPFCTIRFTTPPHPSVTHDLPSRP
jgi:hypothetical protein